jgi:hypothetical protein
MFVVLTNYLKINEEKMKDFPRFKEYFEILQKKTDEIEAARKEQIEYTFKQSIEKKESRKKLEEKIVEISGKMTVYANYTNNFTLLYNCGFSPWGVTRLKQLDLTIAAGNLYKLTEERIEELSPYGIDKDNLNSLKAANDDYTERIADPRQYKVISSTATKRMAQLFKDADEALAMIDLVVGVTGKSELDFYSGYRNNRRQLKTGKVKMALKGQATDLDTGQPVPNALFTFVLTEAVKRKPKKAFKIVKKTKKLGGFKIMHMPRGKYEVFVKKPGYKETNLELTVGQYLVKMVVEMEKYTQTT